MVQSKTNQPVVDDTQNLLMSLLGSNDTKISKGKKQDSSAFDSMSSESGVNALQSNANITKAIQDTLLKTTQYQLADAMINGNKSAQELAPLVGESINAIESIGYKSKPASSPFGFGGVQMEGNTAVEQKPGFAASTLMALLGRPTDFAARSDISKIAGVQKITGTEPSKKEDTKGVYGFDPVTGKVSLQANVPANADIRNMTSQTGIETLPQEQQVAAYGLARKIGGVRGAEKILPSIVNSLKAGTPIDHIEDSMRMQSQSPEFSGALRDAAQSISIGKSESQRNVTFDALDDYVQRGDTEGAKEYLKRMAISSGTADQQNQVMTKERTVEFLGEIRNDLGMLESNGISTGFLKGSYENMLARVGQVKDPEMRKVATKIALAVMNYRRSMTGVAFGMIENEEYKKLFPGINRVGEFNKANLDALEDVLGGDLKKFYSISMGRKNYQSLFENQSGEDLSSLSDEELKKIAGQ